MDALSPLRGDWSGGTSAAKSSGEFAVGVASFSNVKYSF